MNSDGSRSIWQSSWLHGLALLAILGVATWLAVRPILIPPDPVPATAPADVFSAERAMDHLREIAREPHPVGSPAQACARDYIVQQIRAMGLTPVVEPMSGAVPVNHGLFSANAYNILVRVPGTSGDFSSGAVGVMAHYDSQPNTPGASDDGTGVAGILESMRALQAGPRLRNDLIFILTDAEELDASGADAFYTQHTWAKDIRLIVNLEAAGTTGGSFLMEASPGNRRLAEGFGRAVPHPVGYSFMTQLMSGGSIGYGTDRTIFTDNGVPGLGPVFGWHYRVLYHSALDNVDTLNLGTLQHQGENVLGLARYFGNLDLSTLKTSEDAVFFTVLSGVNIQYPAGWGLPLAMLAGLLLVALIVAGVIRRRLTIGGILAGIVLTLIRIVLPVVLAAGAWVGIASLHPEYWRNVMGSPYQADLYLLGLATLTLAASLALFVLTRRAVSAEHQTAGALILWFVPALLTSTSMPGMSYAFTWPVLAATLLLAAGLARRREGHAETMSAPGWAAVLRLAIAGVVTLVIVAPIIVLIYLLIGFWFLTYTPTFPFIAVPLLLVALMLTLLTPQMAVWASRRPRGRWLAPGITAALAASLIVVASASSGFSSRQPMQNGVWYEISADTGSAAWYSYGEKPEDPWTAQFFPGAIEPVRMEEINPYLSQLSPLGTFRGAAPAVSLPAPEMVVISDETAADVRTLRLHLTSPRQARALLVRLEGSAVLAASVSGIRESDPAWIGRNSWYLLYYGLEAGGVDLTLEVKPAQPLKIVVADQSEGLPALEGVSYTPRSADMMPFALAQELMPYPETTSVVKTFDLP